MRSGELSCGHGEVYGGGLSGGNGGGLSGAGSGGFSGAGSGVGGRTGVGVGGGDRGGNGNGNGGNGNGSGGRKGIGGRNGIGGNGKKVSSADFLSNVEGFVFGGNSFFTCALEFGTLCLWLQKFGFLVGLNENNPAENMSSPCSLVLRLTEEEVATEATEQ